MNFGFLKVSSGLAAADFSEWSERLVKSSDLASLSSSSSSAFSESLAGSVARKRTFFDFDRANKSRFFAIDRGIILD